MTSRTSFVSPISNPSYMLALAMFACAVVVNTPNELYFQPIAFVLIYMFGCFLFVSIRLWWAAAAIVLVNIIIFGARFPRTANHSNLELFISLFIFGLLVYYFYRPGLLVKGATVNLLFRIAAVCIYFYTGFHKLNSDFLNTDVTCANYINQLGTTKVLNYDTPYPKLLSQFFIYITLFIELVLPWGLLWHTTRKYTAIIFLCFHFYLSFLTLTNFGAFAAFLIFGCLYDFDRIAVPAKLRQNFRVYLGYALLAIAVLHVLHRLDVTRPIKSLIYGCIFNMGYLYFFIHFFRDHKVVQSRYRYRDFALSGAVVVLISIWSMKAYVGLGNTANLTMFSNLVTESSRNNHLLIDTKKTKLTDFEEDNLQIISLDHPVRAEYLHGYRLPVIEFKYLVGQYSETYPLEKLPCTLVYKGETLVIPDLKQSQFADNKWWYKYLYFRKFKDKGPQPCLW